MVSRTASTSTNLCSESLAALFCIATRPPGHFFACSFILHDELLWTAVKVWCLQSFCLSRKCEMSQMSIYSSVFSILLFFCYWFKQSLFRVIFTLRKSCLVAYLMLLVYGSTLLHYHRLYVWHATLSLVLENTAGLQEVEGECGMWRHGIIQKPATDLVAELNPFTHIHSLGMWALRACGGFWTHFKM